MTEIAKKQIIEFTEGKVRHAVKDILKSNKPIVRPKQPPPPPQPAKKTK